MRSERSIINDWVVGRVDGCTCGGGFGSYPHENGCGWEPLFRLSEAETALAEIVRLRDELQRARGRVDMEHIRADRNVRRARETEAEMARLREVIDSVREMHKPNFMSPYGRHYGCAECINRLDDNCRTFKALASPVLPVQTDDEAPLILHDEHFPDCPAVAVEQPPEDERRHEAALLTARAESYVREPVDQPGCRYDRHGACPPGTPGCDCWTPGCDLPRSTVEQPETCDSVWIGCYAANKAYRCKLPAGHDGAHHGDPIPGPVPATKDGEK